MKNKHDEGFSLIELLVAIVILTAIVVPTCSALVMTNEMNNRSDDLMKAQLAVSSAVEKLMAKGIKENTVNYNTYVVGLDDGVQWNSFADKELLKTTEPEYAALLESKEDMLIRKSTDSNSFSEEVFWVVERSANGVYYTVTAISKDGLIEVTTSVRKVSERG